MRAAVFTISLCVLLVTGGARAAPDNPTEINEPASAYESAADNLPFGLDRIRWGMSSAEVQLTYPKLQFTSIFDYPAGSAWGPRELTTYQYSYGDCVFDVVFTFFHARLASVGASSAIDGDALRTCRAQVRQDFARRYGVPERGFPHWIGSVTNIQYDMPAFAVPVRPPAPRPPRPLHIYFFDAQDISGAVAEQHSRDSECLSITAEVIGEAPNDSSYAPFIVPPLRNLGCDYYPPVSWRLQEQGKVIVEARILADGSVADATLAVPQKSPRLNQTALEIVRSRLVISPAISDGKPVETRRQIAVTFTLTHFIHGVQ